MRKNHRVYPYALAVLTLFLGYQIYTLVTKPTIGLALLSMLYAIIIVLIYREYRTLRHRQNCAVRRRAHLKKPHDTLARTTPARKPTRPSDERIPACCAFTA